MDAKLLILEGLDEICRSRDLDDLGDIQWDDGQLLRQSTVRAQRGDPHGWKEFLSHLRANRRVASGFMSIFEELGWATYAVEEDGLVLTLPEEFPALADPDANALAAILNPELEAEDKLPGPRNQELGGIMYLEEKPGLAGHARIGRVTFSATRKTIYYAGRKLQSLKGAGYKANYMDVDSGLEYWISNCKKDGNDSLYPAVVEIDDDAREQYWTEIRKMPQNADRTSFRSEGKYAKRRPS